MKVTKIVESGTNNLLQWAIRNNANIKNNLPLASLINDELVYLATIEDVNFYELYKLTQMYRTHLKVCGINRSKMPTIGALESAFPNKSEAVRKTLEMSNGLIAQMNSDSDIIPSAGTRLFIPMIMMTYTVQIPWSFIDFISTLTDEEAAKVFSTDYAQQLDNILVTIPNTGYGILNAIVRNVQNTRYNPKYEKLVKVTKYSTLQEYPEQLFQIGLVGFSKFNVLTHGETRCNMFEAEHRTFTDNMKAMARLSSPLMVDVAIQLPLFYMQILESSYFPEDVRISYRSSIDNILDNGMTYNNFVGIEDSNNVARIDNYRVRITEANLENLTMIKDLTTDKESDPVSTFALLPPLYRTNAVLTIDADKIDELTHNSDLVVSALFEHIREIINQVKNNLEDVK